MDYRKGGGGGNCTRRRTATLQNSVGGASACPTAPKRASANGCRTCPIRDRMPGVCRLLLQALTECPGIIGRSSGCTFCRGRL